MQFVWASAKSIQKEKFQNMRIYCGKITFADISINTSLNSYLAFLFGGFLHRYYLVNRPEAVLDFFAIKKAEMEDMGRVKFAAEILISVKNKRREITDMLKKNKAEGLLDEFKQDFISK